MPCAWCHAPESELGHHLVRCPNLPHSLQPSLQLALDAICTEEEYQGPSASQPSGPELL
jgi:hypothetical protein